MVSGGQTGHSYPEAAKPEDITKTAYLHLDLRLHPGLGQQDGPMIPTYLLVVLQTTVVLQGSPIQKVKCSSFQASVITQGQWDPVAQQHAGGLSLHQHKLLYTIPLALLGSDSMQTSALSLTCPASQFQAYRSPQHRHHSVFLSFPPLHYMFIHCSGACLSVFQYPRIRFFKQNENF